MDQHTKTVNFSSDSGIHIIHPVRDWVWIGVLRLEYKFSVFHGEMDVWHYHEMRDYTASFGPLTESRADQE